MIHQPKIFITPIIKMLFIFWKGPLARSFSLEIILLSHSYSSRNSFNLMPGVIRIPMAEIADHWILYPEGFWFRFIKTEGFRKGKSRILQVFNENISFHTHFLHLWKKIVQLILPLGIRTVNLRTKFVSRYRIKTEGLGSAIFWSRGIKIFCHWVCRVS